MTVDYHATFPDWAVAMFLIGWLLLILGLVVTLYLSWRDGR